MKYRVYRRGVEVTTDGLPLPRALNGEDIHGEEVEIVFPGGKRVTLLNAAAPIRSPAGAIEGAVTAYADITGFKEFSRSWMRAGLGRGVGAQEPLSRTSVPRHSQPRQRDRNARRVAVPHRERARDGRRDP